MLHTEVISVKNLTKTYKNGRGIQDISFSVNKGDVVGLLGPNGSGKTTTMKAIIGLCHPEQGEILVFGKSLEGNFEKIMANVGALIEAPAIYSELTAYKNLELAANFYPHVNKVRINKVLELVHLDQYKNDKAGRFSLGMKQRLGLALTFLSEPQLIILDEPANGLDIEGMIEIREIISAMSQKYGTTFLISSHLAPELEKVCNKVCVIHSGEMIDFTDMSSALELNPTLEDYFLRKVREKRGTIEI